MAKLWICYREGLRLVGAVVAEVSLEDAVARLDIAPWRFFSATPPAQVRLEQAEQTRARKRVLLEVTAADRYDLCGLLTGVFESPYSLRESLRRLNLAASPAGTAASEGATEAVVR
jgi:hypothetical protein